MARLSNRRMGTLVDSVGYSALAQAGYASRKPRGRYAGLAAALYVAYSLSPTNLEAQDKDKTDFVVIVQKNLLKDENGKKSFDELKKQGAIFAPYNSDPTEVFGLLKEKKLRHILYLDTADKMALKDLPELDGGNWQKIHDAVSSCNPVKVNIMASQIDPDPEPDAIAGSIPIQKSKDGLLDWDTAYRMISTTDLEIRHVVAKGAEGIIDNSMNGTAYAEARTGEDGKLDPNGKVRKLIIEGDGKLKTSYVSRDGDEILRLLNRASIDLFVWAGGHGNSHGQVGGWNYKGSNPTAFDGKLYFVHPDGTSERVDSKNPKVVLFPATCQAGRIEDPENSSCLAYMRDAGAVVLVGYPFDTFDGRHGFGLVDRLSGEEPSITKARLANEIGTILERKWLAEWRKENPTAQMGMRDLASQFYPTKQILYGNPKSKARLRRNPKVEMPFEKISERKVRKDGSVEYEFTIKKKGDGEIRRSPIWTLDTRIKNPREVKATAPYGHDIGDDYVCIRTEKVEGGDLKTPTIPDNTEYTLRFIADE